MTVVIYNPITKQGQLIIYCCMFIFSCHFQPGWWSRCPMRWSSGALSLRSLSCWLSLFTQLGKTWCNTIITAKAFFLKLKVLIEWHVSFLFYLSILAYLCQMHCVYVCARISVNSSNVQSLLDAANQYQIEPVKKMCVEFLKGQIDATNCLGKK